MITIKDIEEKLEVEGWYAKEAIKYFNPELMKPFAGMDLDDERNADKIVFEDTKENWIAIASAVIKAFMADSEGVSSRLKECLDLLG